MSPERKAAFDGRLPIRPSPMNSNGLLTISLAIAFAFVILAGAFITATWG